MKKLLFLFFGTLFGTSIYSQSCPTPTISGAHVTIDSTYQIGTTTAGKTNVGLCFYNNSGTDITAVQFRMFYDNQAFGSVDTITSLNNTFSQYLQYQDNPAGGYVTITMTYTGSMNTFNIPDGPLFQVSFNHTAALSTTYFNVSNLTFIGASVFNETATSQAGNDFALNLTNFGGQFLSRTFSFSANFMNVTGTPAKHINVALEKKLKASSSWTSVETDTTNLQGWVSFTDVNIDTTAFDVRIAVQGDTMNFGNIISVADAQRVNQYVLGQQTPTGFDFHASDVNGDGVISISDVYAIYGRISGRFNSWIGSVQDVKFFTEVEFNTVDGSSSNLISSTTGVTNFNYEILPNTSDTVTYYVLGMGDANGTGFKRARLTPIEIVNPNNANLHIIDVTTEYDNNLESIEVNFPELGVDEGDLVSVPVTLKTNNIDLGSLQLAMNYDGDLLDFESLVTELKGSYWLTFLNINDNQVEWGGYDPSFNQNLVNNGEILFTLNFTAKEIQSNWNKSPLYVSRKFAGDENATDLKITPTDGILQVLKMDPNEVLVNNQMVLYPTPTSDYVTARFKLYEKGEITLAVYDLGGKLVFEVIEGTYPIGIYEETFNLGELPAGEYVAILNTNKKKIVERTTKIN
jgi:hypothetical protein